MLSDMVVMPLCGRRVRGGGKILSSVNDGPLKRGIPLLSPPDCRILGSAVRLDRAKDVPDSSILFSHFIDSETPNEEFLCARGFNFLLVFGWDSRRGLYITLLMDAAEFSRA